MAICFRIGIVLAATAASLCAADAVAQTGRRVVATVKTDPRTGRLVRSVTVAAGPVVRRAAPQPALADLDKALEQVAAQQALPAGLLRSVIKVESNYNARAVSPKGAMGLMQLIPATAQRFGVADVFNPIDNLEGGARYLRHLLDLYGDYPLALAAYNAGESAVARYGGIPPFPETRDYVALVKRAHEQAQRAEAARAPEPAPAQPAGGYNRIEEVITPDGRVTYVSR